MPEEQVLVIKRDIFEYIGAFNGINFEVDKYLSKFWEPGHLKFLPRTFAENAPEYKQLIPYTIMTFENSFLCYIRGKQGDEPRLIDKASIGIGGHINPSDVEGSDINNFYQTYLNAVAREVEEEVVVDADYNETIVGLLNDDSNDVGRVHLGVIHFWELSKPNVKMKEEVISKLQFLHIAELLSIREKMESWSKLCLDNINEIIKKAKR